MPHPSESELLANATRYSFRARMDKKTNEGPVFASGKDSVVTDVNGKEYGKEVMQIAAGPGTGWVSFMFKDPITGKVLPKENYVERAGDYIYLAGVYTR